MRTNSLTGSSAIWRGFLVWCLLGALFCVSPLQAAAEVHAPVKAYPPDLSSYNTPVDASLWEILRLRVQTEPLNLAVTVLFLLAILHTFLAPMFVRLSHRFEREHRDKLACAGTPASGDGSKGPVSFKAEVCHFLGEVEAIFGIWVVPLLILIGVSKGWETARYYLGEKLNFTEPLFVVVIMTIAASRPILNLSERMMSLVAGLGGGTPAAWWLSILTLGPMLGSFITEPAAMTISALLLGRKFYEFKPSSTCAHATLGLLFVNISVGGTLTHFAAPPVLMVAGKWNWDMGFMFTHFGWKAAIGILVANGLYFLLFQGEFKRLGREAIRAISPGAQPRDVKVPSWIIGVHLLFLAWTVLNNHFSPLFIGGFLFYLAFTRATEHHQGELALRPALLVGFFLAGLVVHGGLQGWWIGPVLRHLDEKPLFFGAAFLTAFNDNAAITYLASLVPDFGPEMKYAVVAGAVAGGGLTVIANAPNPAGQSILSRFFPEGISPLKLALGALAPTVIVSAAFLLLGNL